MPRYSRHPESIGSSYFHTDELSDVLEKIESILDGKKNRITKDDIEKIAICLRILIELKSNLIGIDRLSYKTQHEVFIRVLSVLKII